ncbi:MAG TPA: hypothetical protein VFZ65_16990 [Planctomycetota bacterium]|nr:hypothetical protein [Planctomycetota bacterium]
MLPGEGDRFDAPHLEAVLWGALGVVAAVLARRSPKGSRAGWWVVVAGVVTIVLDKLFDVYSCLHAIGRGIATAIDPELHLRGAHASYRDAALVVLFAAGSAGLVWLVRRDESIGRAKLLCFAGFVVVLALVLVRLVPTLQEHLPDALTKLIEVVAWSLVVAGEWLALRRPRVAGVRPDGYL